MFALATQHQDIDSRLQGRRILVVGLGQTGLSCARFLTACGYEVAVTDSREQPPALDTLQDQLPDVAVFVGGFNDAALAQADAVVVSPGVSLQEPYLQQAAALKLPLLGDIELFARFVSAPVIAVTGSNGKSTVTALLGEMAREAGKHVGVGGNIGVPVLDLLQDEAHDLYVLELSSFQLETTASLNPVAATILNISPDHMDRYRNIDDYSAAKQRIFNGDGSVIVNTDDPRVLAMAQSLDNRQQILFGLGEPQDGSFGVHQIEGDAWLAYGQRALLPVAALRIHGEHNVSNALAALALGQAAGLSQAAMLNALRRFRGLPHRTEWVAEHNGVIWLNDSKATNVGATLAALNGLQSDRVVLLAGGQAKGQDFRPLKDVLRRRARALVLFGADADVLARQLGSVCPLQRVDSLSAAVSCAAELAQPGDAVLLSPACASFDMFSGFADRGEQFIAAVRRQLA